MCFRLNLFSFLEASTRGIQERLGERRSGLDVTGGITRLLLCVGEQAEGKSEKKQLRKIAAAFFFFALFSIPVIPDSQKPQRAKHQAKDQIRQPILRYQIRVTPEKPILRSLGIVE